MHYDMQIGISVLVWAAVLWLLSRGSDRGNPPLIEAAVASSFVVLDCLTLSSPVLIGLASSPISFPLLCMVAVRANFLQVGLRLRGKPHYSLSGGVLFSLNAVISGCLCYALLIEPYAVRLETVKISSPKLKGGEPLKIVQLSDLHVERFGLREKRLLELLDTLQYDLLLLTGDYMHLSQVFDKQALEAGREVLSRLQAPYGIYAIAGNVDPQPVMKFLFTGLPIEVLNNEFRTIEIKGHKVNLAGLATRRWSDDAPMIKSLLQAVPKEHYTIMLYHTPNLADEVAEQKADLYLAGHTHGGQIRLPFYGAIATLARHGKRFEAGLYQVGDTNLYISRGIGVEGFAWTPSVRFLAPPEVTMLVLQPG